MKDTRQIIRFLRAALALFPTHADIFLGRAALDCSNCEEITIFVLQNSTEIVAAQLTTHSAPFPETQAICRFFASVRGWGNIASECGGRMDDNCIEVAEAADLRLAHSHIALLLSEHRVADARRIFEKVARDLVFQSDIERCIGRLAVVFAAAEQGEQVARRFTDTIDGAFQRFARYGHDALILLANRMWAEGNFKGLHDLLRGALAGDDINLVDYCLAALTDFV